MVLPVRLYFCVDGLHQQCVQRRSDVCSVDRPECEGFYRSHSRVGLQREAVLLLAEHFQEDSSHAVA